MNECDLEEVKHALCQEALSVPIEQWVETGEGYKTKDGRFLLEDRYLLGSVYNQLKVRTSSKYEVIGDAYWSFHYRPAQSEEDKEFREKIREQYNNSPPRIILSRIKEYKSKIEEEEKCRRLTAALGVTLKENDEGIVDNNIPNKPWWRFW